jgi:hypothetical protein
MKRILILVLLLSCIPLSLFAELGVGGVAFLNSPVLIGQPLPNDGVGIEDFTFGGNLRWKLALFQADALALVTMGTTPVVDIYADAEVVLDIMMFRLSIGAGPTIHWEVGGPKPLFMGFNAKANADIKLGRLSVGLSYIMNLIVDNGISLDKSTGMLGATVLFWL